MRRGLQVFLTILGSVALLSGLVTALWGASSIAGVDVVTPEVDSEMRFFAIWYVAAGGVVLRAVHRVELEAPTVRAVAGLFFLAGCSVTRPRMLDRSA